MATGLLRDGQRAPSMQEVVEDGWVEGLRIDPFSPRRAGKAERRVWVAARKLAIFARYGAIEHVAGRGQNPGALRLAGPAGTQER